MKRSVAILGPTPAFVRWTLVRDCELRDVNVENLPDATFRQLRSLRALSDAIHEQRCLQGICLHESAVDQGPQLARGFPAHEIHDLYGSSTWLDQQCGECPANIGVTNHDTPQWAGCFGWLASDLNWDPLGAYDDSKSISDFAPLEFPTSPQPEFNVIQRIAAIGNLRWDQLWRSGQLNPGQIALLNDLFKGILAETNGECIGFKELSRFVLATRRAMSENLSMQIEYVPPGYSDGSTWTIFSNCPDCGTHYLLIKGKTVSSICRACGRPGNPPPEKKCKVLGLRPYMLLHRIIGLEKTEQLLAQYVCKKPST